ncbi:MAG: CDP-alcohol phosphatidyltransferase family protein, partial [Spirochaetes bacterium]|nr:CDP-alcohol phosphatidyltransferase family protein [Spirochaetota bacterium]
MIPEHALIESPEGTRAELRVCGLYLLERAIILLSRAGVKHIHLKLSDAESRFYRDRVARHVRVDAAVTENTAPPRGEAAIVLPSDFFFQAHHLANHAEHFTKKKAAFLPAVTGEMFPVKSAADARRAEERLVAYIRDNTPGFIARNINKAISLPISRVLSRTRIHPNWLTVFNMIVGFSSAFLIARNSYWFIVLGGLFFQLASVFDGVDGEVAKMTLKVSKLGGWLDTVSDNGTLLLFLSASSYLYFINSESALVPAIFIALLFLGLGIMIGSMVSFLRKHTDSGSLVTYDKEFLQKLPDSDPLVRFIHRLKYYTKKEFFSLAFFAICLTGKIHLLVPIISVILAVAAVLLVTVNARYRDFTMGHPKRG